MMPRMLPFFFLEKSGPDMNIKQLLVKRLGGEKVIYTHMSVTVISVDTKIMLLIFETTFLLYLRASV